MIHVMIYIFFYTLHGPVSVILSESEGVALVTVAFVVILSSNKIVTNEWAMGFYFGNAGYFESADRK